MFTYCFAGADGAHDGGVRREGAAVDPVLMAPQDLHHITCETEDIEGHVSTGSLESLLDAVFRKI